MEKNVYLAAYRVDRPKVRDRVAAINFFMRSRPRTLSVKSASDVPLIPAFSPFSCSVETASDFVKSKSFQNLRLMGSGVRLEELVIDSHEDNKALGFRIGCDPMIERSARDAREYLRQGDDYSSIGYFGKTLPEDARLLVICYGNGLLREEDIQEILDKCNENSRPPPAFNDLPLSLYSQKPDGCWALFAR